MLQAALAHYTAQQDLSRRAAAAAARLWSSGLDPQNLDGSWAANVQQPLRQQVTARQLLAATAADSYTDQALAEQDLDSDRSHTLSPAHFAGVASDGRDLDQLLAEPVITVKTALLQQQPMEQALRSGLSSLLRIVSTQVSDAGRTADGVALTARPAAGGYIRILTPPSCPRCAILAGKFFRWNAGFARHPHCDCRHVPTAEKLAPDQVTDPQTAFRAGQIIGLSVADAQAVEDGADLGKVVNAHRGMYSANTYGRDVKATRAAATRGTRLRPESIYQLAGDDRTEALRLLSHFGYLSPARAAAA